MIEALPSGSTVARLCAKSLLGSNGEIAAGCFTLRAGTDERPEEDYLSVHWLEYLGLGTAQEKVAALRHYLLTDSPFTNERRPPASGRIAVLDCDAVVAAFGASEMVGMASVQVRHAPRAENVAPGLRSSPAGQMVVGVDRAAAAAAGLLLDPHSGIYSVPIAAAHELAFKELLVASVIYSEPGKLLRP